MPVLVKGPSEYKNNFQWLESRKSRSYSPPLQAMKPAAGVKSEIAAKTSEPKITSKKKTITTTSTTMFENGQGDDYMLLGNTDKFASNVQYRAKSRDRAMNLLKKTHPSAENGDGEKSTPLAPRKPDPAPAVKYNTGAPVLKAKKSDIEPTQTKSSKAVEVVNGRPAPVKSAMKQTKSVSKAKSQEPMKSKGEPEKRHFEPVLQPKKHNENDDNKKVHQGTKKKEARKGQMHEFVQVDMDKGVTYSQQEAPADYAMKYKAGVAPPRAKGPKRLSEYSMQFQWKKGFPSSPMLAAEQIVYKNNPQAPPFHPDSMAKASEYKKEFQPWHMLKSTPNLAQAMQDEEEYQQVPQKKIKKHKRSRSLEDARPAAGGSAYVSAEDKRMIKESLNPQKLHFPHGKFKKVRSEYDSNFAAPQKFDYHDGAWMGADPPQLAYTADAGSILSQADELNTSVAWFHEVMELRKKAQEYKKRAYGTHFSRQHTGQLYSKTAEVWDTVSDAGDSVVSALSLESGASRQSRASKASSARQERKSKKDAWQDDSEAGSVMDSPATGSCTPATERTLTPDQLPDDDDDYYDDGVESVSTYRSDASSVQQQKQQYTKQLNIGRIPTPKLRLKTHTSKNRHHLDRTTPAMGGALLSSPPEKDNLSEDSGPIVSKKGHKKRSIPAHAVRESFSAPTLLQTQNKASAFGKPTADSHVLVDEDGASDHTLNLDFIRTQPQVEKEREKDLQTRLSTIKEMSGEYKSTTKSGIVPQLQLTVDDIPIRPPTEDDCISLSAMSIASSSSFASEVLERAKHRRNEFWSDSKPK